MNAPASTDALRLRAQRLAGFLEQDPENVPLRTDLADLLLELDETETARQHVEAALARQPQDGPLRYRRAVILHRQGELTQAHAQLSELLAQGVDEPVVHFEMGRVQFAQGEFARAIQTLAPLCQAASPAELRPMAAFLSVRGLHQLGELDAAIQLAESVMSTGGSDSALGTALATLYLDAGRPADAARLYAQAEAAEQLNPELLSVGGYLAFGEADLGVAQARFKASLAAAPHLGRSHLGLGLLCAIQGNVAQARTELETAAQAMPTHLGTWHALAWMHLLVQDVDAAEAAFEKDMAADRNFGENHGGLALIAALRGDRLAAQELCRTGAKLDPAAFNVGAAVLLLREGTTMASPAFREQAFRILHDRLLSQDAGLRALFDKLMRAPRPSMH